MRYVPPVIPASMLKPGLRSLGPPDTLPLNTRCTHGDSQAQKQSPDAGPLGLSRAASSPVAQVGRGGFCRVRSTGDHT